MQNQIERIWKTTLVIEKEHKIKEFMEVQHELDYNQASILAEACIQCFKIRNMIGRVAIGDVQDVHDEGVALWKTILSQQKEAIEEIAKETKQDQGATTLDKGKGKDKYSTKGFNFFLVDDIISSVVLDILNQTKDVEQLVEHKSTIETIDIGVSSVKGTTQTKHPGEDEVLVEDIPYEEKPHITLVIINRTNNEPLSSEKGAEEGNLKVINSSVLPIQELEKKETKEKQEKHKEVEKKEEEMKEIKETNELEQHKKKEDSSFDQPEDGKKKVVETL